MTDKPLNFERRKKVMIDNRCPICSNKMKVKGAMYTEVWYDDTLSCESCGLYTHYAFLPVQHHLNIGGFSLSWEHTNPPPEGYEQPLIDIIKERYLDGYYRKGGM